MVRIQSAAVFRKVCRSEKGDRWMPERISGPLEGGRAPTDFVQGLVHDAVYEVSVYIATLDWFAVLSNRLEQRWAMFWPAQLI